MFRGRQIRVEGTVVEAEEPSLTRDYGRGPSKIILDVHTPEGKLVRVTFKQRLVTDNLRTPRAGAVVPVDWDPKRGTARLALTDTPYDLGAQKRQEKDAFKAAANAPAGTPASGAVKDQEGQQLEQEAKRLLERRKSGAITDAEFEQETRRLLKRAK